MVFAAKTVFHIGVFPTIRENLQLNCFKDVEQFKGMSANGLGHSKLSLDLLVCK